MEQNHFITELLEIKDPNITILELLDTGKHKEVIAKLDYSAPKCPNCQGKWLNTTSKKHPKYLIWNVQDTRH